MRYITDFHLPEYQFLSNFYPCKVLMEDGVTYPSAEHAYVAQKTDDMEIRRFVSQIKTPGEAKKYGRRVKLTDGFEEKKYLIMKSVVLAKFTQNEDLMEKLLDTCKAVLIEGNHWKDRYWGVDGYGENKLGEILMDIREGEFLSRELELDWAII